MKMQFLADSLDAKLVKRPHRAVGLALAGAETGEIMPSDKPVRCFLHQARFQRVAVMPDPSVVEGRWLPARQNAVEIVASGGGKPGMRLVRHLARVADRDRMPRCERVHRRHHPVGVEFVRDIQMRHLAGGMNARIRAARPVDRTGAAGQLGRGVLEDLLHRQPVILALPANERAAVIFDGDENPPCHDMPTGVPAASWLPFR